MLMKRRTMRITWREILKEMMMLMMMRPTVMKMVRKMMFIMNEDLSRFEYFKSYRIHVLNLYLVKILLKSILLHFISHELILHLLNS